MKKILASMLAFVICLGACSFVLAEAIPGEESKTAKEQTEAYISNLIGMADSGNNDTAILSEYAEVLKSVYPEFKLYANMEEKVSREDFLVALVNIVYGKNYPAYTLFGDTAPDNTALLDSLGCAINVGMISPSDLFRPDDAISYGEMYKMTVVALGYNMLASQNGGWPAGYMLVASKTGLDQNVEENSGEVSAKDALTVLYNVITLEFMEQTSFGETFVYTVAKGKTILGERYKTELIQGVVTADDVTSLTDEDAFLSKGEIKIDTVTYRNLSGKSLLGYRVKAYIRTNGNKKEVISIHKYENREIFADDFTILDSNKIRVHQPDGKDKDYNIYKGYSSVLNNVASPYIDLSAYEGRDDVTLYLIDNDNDNTYDVIKIYDWDYLQVGKIDTVNMILFDSNSHRAASDGGHLRDLTINLNSDDVFSTIYDCNGAGLKEISFDDIKTDDILTYAVSQNYKSIIVFRSSQKVSGTLEEYSASDEAVCIGGEIYKLSIYAKERFNNFSLGENVSVFVDATGRVVSIKQTDTGFIYGYLIAMASEGGLNSKYKIKMFTQDGNIEYFDVSDKLFIDNVRSAAKDLYLMEQSLAQGDRMVKYSVNSNGEIDSVDFASNASQTLPFTENNPERNSLTLYYDAKLEKLGDGFFGTSFVVEGTTKIFQIPKSDKYKNDDSYYLIKSHSDYRNGEKQIKAYDMAPGTGPKVILYFSDSKTFAADEYSSSSVVLEITDGVNAEGESCKLMTTYSGTTYNKYYVKTSLNVSDLNPGDIIAISIHKNEIVSIKKHYTCSDNLIHITPTENMSYYKGYVYSYGKRMMQIWNTGNVNNQVLLGDILGMDFREQKVTFVDVYKDGSGKITKAVARYKPLSEIKDYINSGTNADFVVARFTGNVYAGKWIYRVIQR